MKKYLKLSFIIVFALTLFNACEPDDEYNFGFSEDTNLTRFYKTEVKYSVTQDENPWEVQLKVSGKTMDQDITLTVEVGGNMDTVYVGSKKYVTTAESGVHYTLPSTSVTIPKGESFGTLSINGIFTGLETDGPQDLVLKIASSSIETADYNQLMVVHMEKSCPFVSSEFVGTWEVTHEWSYFDDAYQAAYDVEITNDEDDPTVLYVEGLGTGWLVGPWTSMPMKLVMDDSDPSAPVFELINYTDPTDGWIVTDVAHAFGDDGGTFDVCNKIIILNWGVQAASGGWYDLTYGGGGSILTMK